MTAALIQELAAAQEQAEMLGDHQTAHLLARAAAELASRPTQGQIDAAVSRWDHWRARHDAVAAELAAMRRDAERYRFIRDADKSDDLIPEVGLYAMESLDSYIDAAMAAQEPTP